MLKNRIRIARIKEVVYARTKEVDYEQISCNCGRIRIARIKEVD